MNTHADKKQENKSQSVCAANPQIQSGGESTFQFVDNRPEAIAQRKLQEMSNNSPQVKQATQLKVMADNHSARQQQPIQKKENNTGLPDNLKSGIENLSGYSMDDVKVHRNSDKPAQLQAHAYAQGTDIHLAAGQEKHLPHEGWHVVQQKQGRVKPTMQLNGKINIDDDAGLEKEADVMGAKAFQVVNNRPQTIAQRKLQEMANNSPQAKQMTQLQLMADNHSARQESSDVVQRTKWKYTHQRWEILENTGAAAGQLTYPLPYPAHENDEFDDLTNVHYSPLLESMKDVQSSRGPLAFNDQRQMTAFGRSSGTGNQGPHVMAHIAKRSYIAAGEGVKGKGADSRNPLGLLGTPVAPRPRQVRRMLRERFNEEGTWGDPRTKQIKKAILSEYKALWVNCRASLETGDLVSAKTYLSKLMELNPATVYHVASGIATPAEMKGKGERRKIAISDLEQLLLKPIYEVDTDSIKGLKTIDAATATDIEQKDALKMVKAFLQWLSAGATDLDPGSSESDSETDDLDGRKQIFHLK